MVRLIKEEEPPQPSASLSSSGNLPKIAAARKTEPARLSRLLRGEIDWIVMKCLEKDRSRRYETASGLGRDVERYLRDEAVEACPPSARYRLSKFARKYRKSLATAAAFAALLVAGVVLSTLLAVWALSAEQDANQQRVASDAAKQDALDAKVEAVKQRDEARLTAYAAGMNLAARAWEENNVPRARELLEVVPKEAGGRDLRGFEWYYLYRVCHSEMRTLEGHDHSVLSVAFSPDGQRLVSAAGEFGSIKLWESTTVSPEIQDRRAAKHLVAGLLQQKGLRADVLEHLRTVPRISPARRQEALAVAQTYPENPDALNALAWELVKQPGRPLSDCQKALRYGEEACQLEPKNGLYLNTLGVAHYRDGNYEKAQETLLRSDQINKTQFQGSIPADLAFLAMTQQHLGHMQEAQTFLQRLRECMKVPRWAQDADAQSFLREAEALLAKPKAPGGK